MKKILYIHGWLSSGISNTSEMLKTSLPEYEINCPDIPYDPKEAITFLKSLVKTYQPDIIIGSSLGGFYANQLKGQFKILVNPAFIIPKNIIYPGKHKFYSKRKDNIQEFEFTQEQFDYLLQLEKNQFKRLSWEDRKSTFIIIGEFDDVVPNTKDLCIKTFGKDNVFIGPYEHRLDQDLLNNHIIPILNQHDSIVEKIINYHPLNSII